MIVFALLLLCCGKQTWRTSRRREEVQWGSVKVKEWSCCVARPSILEVSYFLCRVRDMYLHLYQSVVCPANTNTQVSENSLSVLYRNVDFSDSSSLLCLSGQSGSHVCALALRSPGCLFMLLRSVEWVIFTLGHSGLWARFSMGVRENFGMQTREAVCGWGLARLSNGASLWRCFVCFYDIINGS